MPTQLQDLQDEVYSINFNNGWFDRERSFGDDIALLHSEVSEALEAYRDDGVMDTTVEKCLNKNYDYENGSYDHAIDLSQDNHLCKPEGVGSELADVLVRLLDTAERYGMSLDFEIKRKLAYNRTRGNRHGGKNL